ncbi:MAG: hypothetical protein GX610_10845 [Rhodococcus sp.]|nr:hypothetical protein [Rhodococcus sp. (in: high G+C Gram-positive bacteria)]
MTNASHSGNGAVTTDWSELSGRVAPLDTDAARAVGAAVEAFTAPVRIQIAGRGGVGRTTVAAALRQGAPDTEFVEMPAFDVPGADDPLLDAEVVVYVLVDPVRSADRRALGRVRGGKGGSLVVVLNKADTIGADDAAVDARVADCARDCGETVHPLVATTGLGIEPIATAVNEGISRARVTRGGTLIRELRRQAVRSLPARDVIEQYVGSDAAVTLEAAAARGEVLELLLQEPGDVRSADDALRNAQWWQNQAQQSLPGSRRHAALTIHREYVRQWARLSGAAPPHGA